jgi:hypothetical protein
MNPQISGRLDQLAADIGRLRRRKDKLRDALEDFANPQHWGITRDMGEPVPTWIGTYRQSPVDLARDALAGTDGAHIIQRAANHVEALALMLEPTAAQLAAWWAPGQEEAILEAIRIVDARYASLQRRLGA